MVGSQSILGTFREDQLPADATMSVEIDILPIADDNDETARLADLIEGVAGEFSSFEELHGFSIDGVDLSTSALPDGWRDRRLSRDYERRTESSACRVRISAIRGMLKRLTDHQHQPPFKYRVAA